MHNIKTNFDKILEVIKDIVEKKINAKGNYIRRGTVPKFSYIEVIVLSLTAECLSIDSENYLFSKLRIDVYDIHYLKDVKELFRNCIITGDK